MNNLGRKRPSVFFQIIALIRWKNDEGSKTLIGVADAQPMWFDLAYAASRTPIIQAGELRKGAGCILQVLGSLCLAFKEVFFVPKLCFQYRPFLSVKCTVDAVWRLSFLTFSPDFF
jgi:hypothetical protein